MSRALEQAAAPRPLAFRGPRLNAGVMLALPAAAVLFILYVVPLVRLMTSSFVGPSGLGFDAYDRILGDAYERSLVWNSMRLGAFTTVIALAVGYPAPSASPSRAARCDACFSLRCSCRLRRA
jgi:putative spermidine/putrescine transport system permease protein